MVSDENPIGKEVTVLCPKVWLAKKESGLIIQSVGYVIDYDGVMVEVVVPINLSLSGFYPSPNSIGCQPSECNWQIAILQNVMVSVYNFFLMFLQINALTYCKKRMVLFCI